MDPAAATGLLRVHIVGDSAAADLALPTTLQIRELIPRIRATLASGRDDDELGQRQLRRQRVAPVFACPPWWYAV